MSQSRGGEGTSVKEGKSRDKADKANDDGGSGGDGSCIRPVLAAAVAVEAAMVEEDVPCLVLRTMG